MLLSRVSAIRPSSKPTPRYRRGARIERMGGRLVFRAGPSRVFDLATGTAVSGVREDEATEIAAAFAAGLATYADAVRGSRRADAAGRGRPSPGGGAARTPSAPRSRREHGHVDRVRHSGVRAAPRAIRPRRRRGHRGLRLEGERPRLAGHDRAREVLELARRDSSLALLGRPPQACASVERDGRVRVSGRMPSHACRGSSSASVVSDAQGTVACRRIRDGISGITSRASSSGSSP